MKYRILTNISSDVLHMLQRDQPAFHLPLLELFKRLAFHPEDSVLGLRENAPPVRNMC